MTCRGIIEYPPATITIAFVKHPTLRHRATAELVT